VDGEAGAECDPVSRRDGRLVQAGAAVGDVHDPVAGDRREGVPLRVVGAGDELRVRVRRQLEPVVVYTVPSGVATDDPVFQSSSQTSPSSSAMMSRAAVAERLVQEERLHLERPQPVLAGLRVEPGAGPRHGGLVARVDRRRLAPQDPGSRVRRPGAG